MTVALETTNILTLQISMVKASSEALMVKQHLPHSKQLIFEVSSKIPLN